MCVTQQMRVNNAHKKMENASFLYYIKMYTAETFFLNEFSKQDEQNEEKLSSDLCRWPNLITMLQWESSRPSKVEYYSASTFI